jgi:hypothetical protein
MEKTESSVKIRTSNGNKKKDEWTNNDIKNTTQKRSSNRNPLNTGVNSGDSEGLAVPVPLVTAFYVERSAIDLRQTRTAL